MELLDHPWLPARRASGAREWIRPAQMVEGIDDDPVMAIDWPRADFRIASIEFLVGLLSTACPPETDEAWGEWWRTPPSPETLDAAFAPLAHAFVLDGGGPRFMQDLEPLDEDPTPIERLLIDSPGGAGADKNTDLLVRRGRAQVLSRAAAAMALYTLQTYAPTGGAGMRVGLRGGGPLTTLVLPRYRDGSPRPLWHLLWAHVGLGRPPAPERLPLVFPWLAPTRTSEKGSAAVGVAGADPLQAFWGMPRRIRLVFEPAPEGRRCDLTGIADAVVATGWRQRQYGVNYASWGALHPLSPHYRKKPTEPWLAVHPQPGGIGYRHYATLVAARDAGDTARAADAVTTIRNDRIGRMGERRALRLLAAGYDMDNMKARAFVESEMPLAALGGAAANRALDGQVARLIDAAGRAADATRMAVRDALFAPGATVDAGSGAPADARAAVWAATEDPFYRLLGRIEDRMAADADADCADLAEEWLAVLREAALRAFDAVAAPDPAGTDLGVARSRPALARRQLLKTLGGPKIRAALGLGERERPAAPDNAASNRRRST
jgi:CRISPR system Cascade subunit CasA